MIEFMKIGNDSYALYVNRVRVNDIPLTKEEMMNKIFDLKLSDSDMMFIEKFYGGGGDSFAERS